jgi:hypothetical protein
MALSCCSVSSSHYPAKHSSDNGLFSYHCALRILPETRDPVGLYYKGREKMAVTDESLLFNGVQDCTGSA